VEEIENAYIEAWRLGLKAIAVYRDGSKRTQPLNTGRDEEKKAEVVAPVKRPLRRRLPDERPALTHKFSIGGHEGYITVGLFEDGSPGELFVRMAKEGSVISGLMDSFATAVSIMLQYGVPLKVMVNKFSHSRFEPSGFTNNPDIPHAKSVMDYIFRWLSLKFEGGHVAQPEVQLPGLDRTEPATPAPKAGGEPPRPGEGAPAEGAGNGSNGNGHTKAQVRDHEKVVFQLQSDAPPCSECGSVMVRNGSCYRCINCGSTSGCS